MMPKLYSYYKKEPDENEQIKSRTNLQKIDFSGEENAKESEHLQKAEGLLYQFDFESRDAFERIQNKIEFIECFLFKIMSSSNTDNLLKPPISPPYPYEPALSPTNAARLHWENLRKEVINHGYVPLNANTLARIIFENKHLILKNLQKTLRVNLRIETKFYQRNLQLKEIIFESVQPSEKKVHRFFKILTETLILNTQLMEVLSISPDDLNLICRNCLLDKLCKSMKKIRDLKNIDDSFESNTAKKVVGGKFEMNFERESFEDPSELNNGEEKANNSSLFEREKSFEEDQIHIVPNNQISIRKIQESLENMPIESKS